MNFDVRLILGLVLLSSIVTPSLALAQEQSLKIIFPKTNYKTTGDRIFVLGTAPTQGQVLINGKPITQSQGGHFAPTLPLQLGDNLFTVQYQNQQVQIKVTRVSTQPEVTQELTFAKDSLTPATDIARLPGELICFTAIAYGATPRGIAKFPQKFSTSSASVSVKLGNQTISLLPQSPQAQLPANSAALTGRNQPSTQSSANKYEGCTTVATPGNLGQPEFQLTGNGKTITQLGAGKIEILPPAQLQVVEVTTSGVARSGSSTDYSRLTPLPQGTRATVTGREGEWLRLDYGAWINSKETRTIPGAIPPRTIIRSVGYRHTPSAAEIVFPLQVPVPVSVQQGDNTFSLTLYNTTAQTDIIPLGDDPLISRLDWQQMTHEQVKYTFNLKKSQQWGYKLRYEGTSLILSLRYPPASTRQNPFGFTRCLRRETLLQHWIHKHKPLSGIKILLDPGHGGAESGAPGPNGYLEKDVNLAVSKLLRDELVKRGATVVMTREEDKELSLGDRVAIINKEEPTISISVHHNSLPDDGDAEKIKGFSSYWYNTQAHSLALFLHDYFIKKLKRPDYGVFWDNLALTRPEIAPSVLLEIGFMSNPEEFEVVTNPQEQKKEARAIAQGIVEWFKTASNKSFQSFPQR